MTLTPAPRGTGLKAEKKSAVLITLAGIKDVYTATEGKTSTKLNLFRACFSALENLSKVKIKPEQIEERGITEGVLGK